MSSERNEFEKAWEKAFENAYISPPESNWNKIRESLGKKKSRGIIMFYRMSVAASVLLTLSVGLYFGLKQPANEDSGILSENSADKQVNESVPEQKSNIVEELENVNKPPLGSSSNSDKDIHVQEQRSDQLLGNDDDQERLTDLSDQTNEAVSSLQDYQLASDELNSIESTEKVSVTTKTQSPLPFGLEKEAQLGLADNIDLTGPELDRGKIDIRTPNFGYDLLPDEKQNKEETIFLAGVNFSTGVFDQNSSLGSAPEAAPLDQLNASLNNQLRVMSYSAHSLGDNTNLQYYNLQLSEENTQSEAYSYGLDFGMRLGKRFLIYSGLNYTQAFSNQNGELGLTYNGRVLANKFYDRSLSDAEANENSVYDGTVRIRNEYEFLSIPVKAGYSIVDKKFNLTLFTGISSEFLLGNTISSNNEYFQQINESNNGENQNTDSYNTVYLNGVISINAGYTIMQRYHIYVEPMYKRALTDFVKQEVASDRIPTFKMMMLGLSYQF